jgi:hypothetical protein
MKNTPLVVLSAYIGLHLNAPFHISSAQAVSPGKLAVNNTGMFPKDAGCFPGVKGSYRTFPGTYSVNINGINRTRRLKAGVQYSYSCNGFWGVAEGPVDSIVSLESSDGSTIIKSAVRKTGMVASKFIKDFSGDVRTCISPPFSPKYCSEFVSVSF